MYVLISFYIHFYIYIYYAYIRIDDDLQLKVNINNVLVPKGHASFVLLAFTLDNSCLFHGSIFP